MTCTTAALNIPIPLFENKAIGNRTASEDRQRPSVEYLSYTVRFSQMKVTLLLNFVISELSLGWQVAPD